MVLFICHSIRRVFLLCVFNVMIFVQRHKKFMSKIFMVSYKNSSGIIDEKKERVSY